MPIAGLIPKPGIVLNPYLISYLVAFQPSPGRFRSRGTLWVWHPPHGQALRPAPADEVGYVLPTLMPRLHAGGGGGATIWASRSNDGRGDT